MEPQKKLYHVRYSAEEPDPGNTVDIYPKYIYIVAESFEQAVLAARRIERNECSPRTLQEIEEVDREVIFASEVLSDD